MAEPPKRSSVRSSIPKKKALAADELGAGLQKALGGLTEELGGVVGGLGKTVGGLTQGVAGTLQGLLDPLQQLQQQALGGSEEAGEAYDRAVTMIRKSSKKGNQGAQDLLNALGEALEEGEEDAA